MKTFLGVCLAMVAAFLLVIAAGSILHGSHPALVVVSQIATQRGPSGIESFTFAVTNRSPGMALGHFGVEVLHRGTWYNALPQPSFTNDNRVHLNAGGFAQVEISAPTGRGEVGLIRQPVPPGERWRLAYHHVLASPPSWTSRFLGMFRRIAGNGPWAVPNSGHSAYGPEIPFVSTNVAGRPVASPPIDSSP